MAPQVVGQLFDVTSNSNFKTTPNLQNSYFHEFYLSFEKNYLSPNIPKNHQKIYKTAQNRDLWVEHRDS